MQTQAAPAKPHGQASDLIGEVAPALLSNREAKPPNSAQAGDSEGREHWKEEQNRGAARGLERKAVPRGGEEPREESEA